MYTNAGTLPATTRMSAVETINTVSARVPWSDPDVLDALLSLAIEIACEGREGTRLGALFTIGRPAAVLACSRPLILDPFLGHAPAATQLRNPALRGTIKALAHLDGAFVIAEDGAVVSGCRYLDIPAGGVVVPLGLGSRHVVAAAVSKELGVIAVTVSQTGVVRVFHEGAVLADIRQHVGP
jgi:DNA integrity scanning protein DisA with diadenylate cyclase activity